MTDNKQWYIVKHKTENHWTAYEVTKEQAESIKDGYTIQGPYKTIVQALIAAN